MGINDNGSPPAVRAAFTMWLLAVGAGIFETILVVASGRAGHGAVTGVAIRGAYPWRGSSSPRACSPAGGGRGGR